jgi:hypothetical protein
MKLKKHIAMAEWIGADSWELLNFEQLPRNASAERQIEALKLDQKWQRNKFEETSRSIDELIADIESTSNPTGLETVHKTEERR